MPNQTVEHSLQSTTLADLLERVLDKGIVIAGDIRIKLVEVELLSIQLRLVVCSVDKARELGLDWWTNNSTLAGRADGSIEERVARLESMIPSPAAARREAAGQKVPNKN